MLLISTCTSVGNQLGKHNCSVECGINILFDQFAGGISSEAGVG